MKTNSENKLFTEEISEDKIIELLLTENRDDILGLYEQAEEIKHRYFGHNIAQTGIVEISNYCNNNCIYCCLRNNNNSIKRYTMKTDEILKAANSINKLGLQNLVLQSGENNYHSSNEIADIIFEIKSKTQLSVILNLGLKKFEDYKLWKEAGADYYIIKHETANEKLFSLYHFGEKLEKVISHLKYLKSIGYKTGSGNLVGLPHQTIKDTAKDIILLKELGVDVASISPFIPLPNTPYHDEKKPDISLVLKTIAITRLVLKDILIPATEALENLEQFGLQKGLKVGANVATVNFTPQKYKCECSSFYGTQARAV